jgi:hypothetical protein
MRQISQKGHFSEQHVHANEQYKIKAQVLPLEVLSQTAEEGETPMTGEELLMDLLMEQGPGRDTQVQPPAGAWFSYFGLDPEQLPTLRLIDRKQQNPQAEDRPVVEHGTPNWTIEVAGAAVVKPAIIRFHRTGDNRYEYWVYMPQEPEYAHCDWLLNTFVNPQHRRGRRWFII